MQAQNKRAGEYLAESELILNADGSVYHLKLKPEHVCDNVIVVGDQNRVAMISEHFSEVLFQVQSREFCTHIGLYNGERIMAISSGIGVDNIDITLNELDALANIDFETRTVKAETKSMNIVRIGTCGALQPHIHPGEFVLSKYGFGLDGMLNYYDLEFSDEEKELNSALTKHLEMDNFSLQPYTAKASDALIEKLQDGMHSGVTATASGFYAPQGRAIRLNPALNKQNDLLESFTFNNQQVVNFEMETSALLGLGGSLGHNCCTVCVAVANRPLKKALTNYKPYVNELIKLVLDRLTN